jgi:hypothetical protein
MRLGGQTVAVTGVPSQPNIFSIGVNNCGVWRSSDYTRVWKPIFAEPPTGSIGALPVAASDPNIVYVGSCAGHQWPDLLSGDGLDESTEFSGFCF